LGIYGCVSDITLAEIVFDLKICQNSKGNIYGDIKNTDYITTNMKACLSDINKASHDLYCSSTSDTKCFTFDGTSNGDKVLNNFNNLLVAVIVFDILTTTITFVQTLFLFISIISKKLASPQIIPSVNISSTINKNKYAPVVERF
jgi:hypothetical protein